MYQIETAKMFLQTISTAVNERKTQQNPKKPKQTMLSKTEQIADIAYRLNSMEIGSDEIAALEWLAGHPDEFGRILRDVYRYCRYCV